MSHPLLDVLNLSVGAPVLVKSVGMGIHVGRLAGCEGRAVALTGIDAALRRAQRDGLGSGHGLGSGAGNGDGDGNGNGRDGRGGRG